MANEDGDHDNSLSDASDVHQLLESIVDRARAASTGSSEGATRAQMDPFDIQRLRRQQQDLTLRRQYAIWILIGLGVQLGVADVVFVLYAWLGEHWEIPAVAISAWTGALVVQVIGVVLAITNGLFPKGDRHDYSPPH